MLCESEMQLCKWNTVLQMQWSLTKIEIEIKFENVILKNWSLKIQLYKIEIWNWIWRCSFEKIEIENTALQNWNRFEIEFDDTTKLK